MKQLSSITPTIDIYVKLAQYPILSSEIRMQMREELFRRSIITQADFEQEVTQLCIDSQRREGLPEPFTQEDEPVWQTRKQRIRDYHTDAIFGNNLGTALLGEIINEMLSQQPVTDRPTDLKFNPEIAPWELLFNQGKLYEKLPPPKRKAVKHHLEEIKVVLINRLISDDLRFIGVAKRILTIADLRLVYQRRIGNGKIGGKAAGMLLAWKILQRKDPEIGSDMSEHVSIPDSYFIGTDVIYEYYVLNKLVRFMNQKYKAIEEAKAEYSNLQEAFLHAKMPNHIVEQLRDMLVEVKQRPLIVRSSSLLEDSFGFSFAGKYKTIFCANQGSPKENLRAVLDAIRLIYASILNPDALSYRRKHDLIDYDERMAILLQVIDGERYGRYYFPAVAGVGYSQNPFRWTKKIRREDGFLRMVYGLGTRAVNRVANDFPRLVALSHPQLRPENTPQSIRQHTQWYADVIDLEDNKFKTVDADELLKPDYPALRCVASLDKGDVLQEILSPGSITPDDNLILTFDSITKDANFVRLMRNALLRLERAYRCPVDLEFTVTILKAYPRAKYRLNILQCRPLEDKQEVINAVIPKNIPPDNILFQTKGLIPDGKVENIRTIIYIDPAKYHHISDLNIRRELGRAVGRLNQALENERFALIGPGRWGSDNLDLGVHVTYGDIHNTKILIEIAFAQRGHIPELSYGTHFFRDLVEDGIHALGIHPETSKTQFNENYFRNMPNCLVDILPRDADLSDYLRVIDVTAVSQGRYFHILMNGAEEKAVGYLDKKAE